jgi:hypothetical protein
VTVTNIQLTTLKADILAAQDLSLLAGTPDGRYEIARLYTLPATPDFWVWRSSVSKEEFTGSTGPDGTTFNWTGAGFITRSQGERDAWRELFSVTGHVNPSLANVRQAVADIFSGNTAPAPANRTHLLAVSRRKALRMEKLFAAGAGTTAAPATAGYEGTVSFADVDAALNLPG